MSTVKSVRLKVPATLLALGIALSASPALSQTAMTPGGGAMAPQPRVAPTVAPTAPVAAPQMPVAIPNAPGPVPGDAGKLTVRKAGEPPKDYLKTPDANSGGQPGTTGGKQGFVNIDASNRDHELTTPGGKPTGPGQPTANYQTNPIPGIDVVVKKKPTGTALSIPKTDASGQLTLKQLEAGNYDVALPTAGGPVSMTTFVNGKVQSRVEFPVGSSVGTFAVASPRDTIVLKFESGGSTPVNGIGGTGGGR